MSTLTQAQVFSEFNNLPDEVKAVTRPHIVGGNAKLHRYSDPTEKLGIDVGTYINTTPTTYLWPNKATGSVVDQSYAEVVMDDIYLNYFTDPQGGGSGTITPDGSYPNRIHTNATDGFAANGTDFPRDPLLYDRDVQVGDAVHLTYTASGPSGPVSELYTTVKSLIADVIPASIDSATSDANNAAGQSLNANATQTSGTVNDVAATADGSSYDGLASGFINETYTVTVIQGSTGGDATTARFNLSSASGLDNATNIAFAAFGSPTTLGARGMKATWTHTSNDLVVNQVWSITVSQAFTAPAPTSGGTYIGTEDLTYIITVTLGGKYSGSTKPQVTVTTNLGVDQSGPTTVPAAATAVPAGTLGVTIKFSGTALRKGDIYYVKAHAPTAGAYKTIELNNNLTTALQAAPDMTLALSIKKTGLIIPQDSSTPPVLNWQTTSSNLVLNSGIEMTDPSLMNNGVPVYVPLVSGPDTAVYLQYREWLATYVNEVGSITAASTDATAIKAQVAVALGTVTPDNPLAYAIYLCLLNANGQPVNYTAIADPTVLGDWTDALKVLEGLPVYSLVPLSTDTDVLAAFKTHIDAQSVDGVNRWRVGWFPVAVTPTIPIVTAATSTDHNVVLATLSDNPSEVGTQYTYLTATSGNGQFVTLGVRADDTVRYLFSTDGFGNTTYTEFNVEEVINQDTVVLSAPGNPTPVGVAQKVEIWRNLTKSEIAENLAAEAEAYADKRVRLVWPDQIDVADSVSGLAAGYFVCAALSGFTTGVAPHQGIAGIPFVGFTGASRSVSYFSNAQLNILKAAGLFVVTQDGSGNVFVRDPLTTDTSAPENEFEVVVRNDDAIRTVIANRVAQFYDVANLSEAGQAIIQSEVENGFFVLRSKTFVNRLGNMVTDSQLTDIRPSTIDPTQIIIQATVTRPFPVESLLLNLTFN